MTGKLHLVFVPGVNMTVSSDPCLSSWAHPFSRNPLSISCLGCAGSPGEKQLRRTFSYLGGLIHPLCLQPHALPSLFSLLLCLETDLISPSTKHPAQPRRRTAQCRVEQFWRPRSLYTCPISASVLGFPSSSHF